MKGIENIVGRVAADAQAAASETAAAAAAQAEAILAEAKEQAKKSAEAIMGKARRDAEDIARRADSTMSLEGRKALLAERQSLVEEAFIAAATRLLAMTKEPAKYVGTLVELARGAGSGSTLLIAEADYKNVGRDLEAATGLAVESADLPRGGLVIRQGEVEQNLTFAALLRQYREELEQDVAAALFN